MEVITAVIFAYGGDALLVPLAAHSARLAGCLPVVIDDEAHPLPGHVRGLLHAAGAIYQTSGFNRRGNLNGTDCAAWIAASMADVAIRHGAEYCIKLDADTLLLDAEAFRGSVGCRSSRVARREAFGACYSLETGTAAIVASHLAAQPQDDAAPEDVTIWAAVRDLGLSHRLRDFHPGRGLFCAAPQNASPSDCRRFASITFGNPPRGGWTDRGLEIRRRMLPFVEWLTQDSTCQGPSAKLERRP